MPNELVFDPNNFILKEAMLNGQPSEIIPAEYTLDQNYPNPFNPVTIIHYRLPRMSHVKLYITDVTGRLITTLVNEEQLLGSYSVPFDGSKYSSGVYFYTLQAGNSSSGTEQSFMQTKKMVLVK
jgi:hypothetical protein